MPLTDSHAHLDTYGPDLPAVLARAREAGVSSILAIGIGDGPDTMHCALEIAHAAARAPNPGHPRILASAGIHPQEAHQATPANLAKLRDLLSDPLTVAVGEIGLDYYHVENPDIATQHAAFAAQMHLAASVHKPILIHLRSSALATPAAKARFGIADVWADFFQVIAMHWTPTGLPGVMHCFSGGPAEAEQALAAGFHLSFAGNLTYPKSESLREAARIIPLDRLLIETDAPFLAPLPHRGEQNEPAHIRLTAEFLADLRGLSLNELAAHTTSNFNRLQETAGVPQQQPSADDAPA